MFSLLLNCWKFTIQRLQSCVVLNTLFPYFSMMFPKSHVSIRWLQLIRKYITYLVLEYITSLILYSNQNHMIFTIGTLDYSVEMIPGWLVISLECTYICSWEKHFLPKFLQLNSTLWHLTQNFSKVVSYIQDKKLGRGSISYWKYYFLVFVSLFFQIATNQEWTSYSIIPEWQRYQ